MPTVEQLKKQLLELGIITLVTVLIWIGYSVYLALTNPSQTQVSEMELEPVPLVIDLNLLESLQKREGVSDKTLFEFSIGRGLEEASESAFPQSQYEFPIDTQESVSTQSSSLNE